MTQIRKCAPERGYSHYQASNHLNLFNITIVAFINTLNPLKSDYSALYNHIVSMAFQQDLQSLLLYMKNGTRDMDNPMFFQLDSSSPHILHGYKSYRLKIPPRRHFCKFLYAVHQSL